MTRHTPAALAFAVSLAAATTLMAQSTASDIDAVTATPAVHVNEASGVPYLNGGADEPERAAMRAMQGEFPLQLLFSDKAGAYGVADRVRVLDGRREIVAVQNAGPLLMVKVPPGRYTVEADFGSRAERRSVTVERGGVLLHWASAAVE